VFPLAAAIDGIGIVIDLDANLAAEEIVKCAVGKVEDIA